MIYNIYQIANIPTVRWYCFKRCFLLFMNFGITAKKIGLVTAFFKYLSSLFSFFLKNIFNQKAWLSA